MAHYKRNKHRKSFKGHCTMCSYRSTDGTRRRLLTRQERTARLSEAEQRRDLGRRRLKRDGS
jgi:hypothetical protein